MKNKLIIAIVLILSVLIFFVFFDKNESSTKKIYINYGQNQVYEKNIDWNLFSDRFPLGFDPNAVSPTNTEQLSKLNESQLKLYDSIIETKNKYPVRFISVNKNKKQFGIRVSPSESVLFEYRPNEMIHIGKNDIQAISFSSLDYALNYIDPLDIFADEHESLEKSSIYIVAQNRNSDGATLIPVTPTYLMYD